MAAPHAASFRMRLTFKPAVQVCLLYMHASRSTVVPTRPDLRLPLHNLRSIKSSSCGSRSKQRHEFSRWSPAPHGQARAGVWPQRAARSGTVACHGAARGPLHRARRGRATGGTRRTRRRRAAPSTGAPGRRCRRHRRTHARGACTPPPLRRPVRAGSWGRRTPRSHRADRAQAPQVASCRGRSGARAAARRERQSRAAAGAAGAAAYRRAGAAAARASRSGQPGRRRTPSARRARERVGN
mmetsp:Transcript_18013/g.53855  ORF Transcript_18013/g.53855 Transcript_18013/m.53855 type:complete len:241 (-) Transcript_18013:199-921(-)